MGALLAAAVVAVLGVGAFWMQPPTTATQDVTFVVPAGAGLRTVAAGEKAFACTGANSRSNPFEDKVILTPPAG